MIQSKNYLITVDSFVEPVDKAKQIIAELAQSKTFVPYGTDTLLDVHQMVEDNNQMISFLLALSKGEIPAEKIKKSVDLLLEELCMDEA